MILEALVTVQVSSCISPWSVCGEIVYLFNTLYIICIYRFFRCKGSNISALPERNLSDASMQLANSWFSLFVYCLANKLTRPVLILQAMYRKWEQHVNGMDSISPLKGQIFRVSKIVQLSNTVFGTPLRHQAFQQP